MIDSPQERLAPYVGSGRRRGKGWSAEVRTLVRAFATSAGWAPNHAPFLVALRRSIRNPGELQFVQVFLAVGQTPVPRRRAPNSFTLAQILLFKRNNSGEITLGRALPPRQTTLRRTLRGEGCGRSGDCRDDDPLCRSPELPQGANLMRRAIDCAVWIEAETLAAAKAAALTIGRTIYTTSYSPHCAARCLFGNGMTAAKRNLPLLRVDGAVAMVQVRSGSSGRHGPLTGPVTPSPNRLRRNSDANRTRRRDTQPSPICRW